MARESMTLLQNRNNILPLAKSGLKIAVMGPNANDSIMQWGNYNGYPLGTVTILKGIRAKAKDVKYISGCGLTRNEIMDSRYGEITTEAGNSGMSAKYWNNETMNGTPVATADLREPINQSNGGATVFAPGVELEHFSACYEGTFRPTRSESLLLNVAADDKVRVIVNSDTLINNWKGRERIQEVAKPLDVKAGETYHIKIDYVQATALATMKFDIIHKQTANTADIVNKVGDADIVIFVGGISPRLEGEEMKVSEPGFKGGDRTDIELPQAQRDVIAALHQAGKRVVYVNCSGGAVGLVPESNNAEAILQAWYPGEQGGTAVADVLFGDYNPSGKLPVTFYKNVDQLPDFMDYRMAGRTYRYFKGAPLFPFGYGLSYTTFAFGKPSYKNGKVTVNIKNTGKRAGTETVQLYIKNVADINGPIKSLRSFKRIQLNAGETKSVIIDCPRTSFEGWDVKTNTICVVPGNYEIMVGSSSVHILEGLTLCLGNKLPNEEGGNNTNDAIETVSEPMTEVVALRQVHVEHRHERGAYNPVEYPLKGHGYSNSLATDRIREYLGDKNPAYRSPAEHERGTVYHNARHGDEAQSWIAERYGNTERADCHANTTPDEQRFATPFLYCEHGNERERDVHDAHNDGLDHRVLHTHILEYAWRIIQNGIDTHGLLEHAEHDTHENTDVPVSEHLLCLCGDRILDVGQNIIGNRDTVDACEDMLRLVILAYHHEITRSLRYKADEDGEECCRNSLTTKHVTPADGSGPCGCIRIHNMINAIHDIDDRVCITAKDDEVDEIDHQLAEDNGKLVPRYQHSTDIRRCHLADIHRADSRCQTHANTANDTVNVE
jgi:beta-glucosidase